MRSCSRPCGKTGSNYLVPLDEPAAGGLVALSIGREQVGSREFGSYADRSTNIAAADCAQDVLLRCSGRISAKSGPLCRIGDERKRRVGELAARIPLPVTIALGK